MKIDRKDVMLSYISYDVLCPNCKEKIFMLSQEVKDKEVSCSNCWEVFQLEGDFENQISESPQ